MPDIALQAAFHTALRRRDAGRVGTSLQDAYRVEWPVATVTTATTFWGTPMDVVLPELVSCELHCYGVIEPDVTVLFLDRVGPGSVVFDVGAHLGYYSLLAAELGAEVHAFEPSENTLAMLRKNVAERADVVPKGVWSTDRTLQLKDFGAEHSAVNTFVSSRDEELDEPDASYAVAVTSIDEYVSATGVRPDLIKVDAEGAELEVLLGATETLRTRRPLITIEVGDTEVERRSRQTIEFATRMSYSPFDITVEGLVPHAPQETYGYANVALIPDSTEGVG